MVHVFISPSSLAYEACARAGALVSARCGKGQSAGEGVFLTVTTWEAIAYNRMRIETDHGWKRLVNAAILEQRVEELA
jgi:hypothetical protein